MSYRVTRRETTTLFALLLTVAAANSTAAEDTQLRIFGYSQNIFQQLDHKIRYPDQTARQVDLNSFILQQEFGDLPPVHCYASQLNQVFMNVLTNAMQAIEESGIVTIRTKTDGDDVHVTITDTGVGIPPEDLPRIFDPGFTFRGVGVGTGLGLSTSFNILENHGARTLVDSEVGKGTRFTIVLPIDHAGADGVPMS